jgi:hypothetical protein
MTFNPNWMPEGYGATPDRPQYAQAYDPTKQSLAEYLTGKYDPSALSAFKDQAMRKGPSSWAALAQQSNRANESNSRERGASEISGQTAQAQDALAARGGLSSGARERTAQEGSKNYLAMSQDLAREGNMNDMQIGMNDEQNRIQQLSMLPGMEQDQAKMYEGAYQQDVANTTAENERRNNYNQNIYNQQMQAWAADRQAFATEHSGKKH